MNLLRSRYLAVLPQSDLSIFPPMGGKKRRFSGFLRLAAMLAALGLGSAGAWAATCPVTRTSDTLPNGVAGELRYCLNNFSAGDTINLTATGTITLAGALPTITQNVTITGPGANQLTISGNKAYPILNFNLTAGSAAISGLTFINGLGSTTTPGTGAITISSPGTSTIANCVFSGNQAYVGGAIEVSGALKVTGSTFTGNTSTDGGGAIAAGTGTLTVTNSTFSGNSSNFGGAIYSISGLAVTNSTFSGNSGTGAGAIYTTGGTGTVANSIFTGNSATTTGQGAAMLSVPAVPLNASYNLYYKNLDAGTTEDDCVGCTTNTNAITGSNPNLLPLGNYGGNTQTFLPLPGSPAICAGSYGAVPGGVTTDQRGFPLTAATCGNGTVDIGAVQSDYMQVTTAGDSGAGSLRAAITAANTSGYGGDIDFASSLNGGTITLQSALPTITAAAAIVGPGANNLTISGAATYQVLTVASTANVTLSGLEIANGSASAANAAAGITNTGGSLTLLNMFFNHNYGAYAGAVESSGPLTVTGSAFISNVATDPTNGQGGAIRIDNGTTATLVNSLLQNNMAEYVGGAIYNNGTLMLADNTLLTNSASNVGGALSSSGSVTAVNNIFYSNLAQNAGAGIYALGTVNANYNLFSGNVDQATNAEDDCVSCASNTNAISAADPMLAQGFHGGGTDSQLPDPGSPAICGGSVGLIPAGITTDQRGFSRTTTYGATTCLDLGAVQTNYTAVSFQQQPTTAYLGTAMVPPPTVQLLETNTLTNTTDAPNGIPITLTYSGSGTLSGNTVNTSGGLATFSNLSINQAGMNQQLQASITAGNLTLQAQSNDFNVIGPAVRLQVTAPSTATSGVPFNVAVTAYDAAGNVATGYTGAVAFSSSDTSTYKTLPGNYTFNSADAGVHVFNNLALVTAAASQTVQVNDNNPINPIQGTATLTVNKANPTVTMTPAGPAINVDGSVTFTAAVNPPANATKAGPFLGTMSFSSNGIPIANCTAIPANNTALCTTSALQAGSDSITAIYSGDASYNQSPTSSAITQTVNPYPASLTVTGSPSGTVTAGTTVTFTAKLGSAATLSPVTPAGTVSWTINGLAVAACPATSIALVSGNWVATCTTGALSVPSAGIAATYSGDPNYTAAAPGLLTVNVTKAQSATTLVLTSPTTPTVNQPTTFTATIKPPTGASTAVLPTGGSVTFTDANTAVTLCNSLPLTVGATASTAACTPTGAAAADLTAGAHTIIASYTGDANFIGASSSGLTQSIAQTATTVAVASSSAGNTSVATQSVTFTATITPNILGAISPASTGTVKFTSSDGTVNCAAAPVVPQANGTGTASCTATFPATEAVATPSVTVSATYSGDTNFLTNSGNGLQTVQNFSLAFTKPTTYTTTPVFVTPGYTTATDPFNALTSPTGPITMTVTSSGAYSDALSVTCTVTSVSTSKAVADPSCSASTSTPSGATGTVVTYTISASTAAAVGAYTVSLSAADSAVPALSHATATPLTVFVVGQAVQLSQVPGVAGTENIVFNAATPPSGKAPTTLSTFSCPNFFSLSTNTFKPGQEVATTGYLTCTFSSPTATVANGQANVSVSITALSSVAQLEVKSNFSLAALWGLPLLVLMGWFGSRKSPRRSWVRFLGAILLIVAASFAATGCGGSFTIPASPAGGVLPAGTYLVQVVGQDQNSVTYTAVVPLTVLP